MELTMRHSWCERWLPGMPHRPPRKMSIMIKTFEAAFRRILKAIGYKMVKFVRVDYEHGFYIRTVVLDIEVKFDKRKILIIATDSRYKSDPDGERDVLIPVLTSVFNEVVYRDKRFVEHIEFKGMLSPGDLRERNLQLWSDDDGEGHTDESLESGRCDPDEQGTAKDR